MVMYEAHCNLIKILIGIVVYFKVKILNRYDTELRPVKKSIDQ
jgi:hypothetical protein